MRAVNSPRDLMNVASIDASPSAGRPHSRLRFELIFASAWLAAGLFVLPGVIYAVGATLLGPYGDAKGVGTLYGDFFRDLAEPSGRAWALALGPLTIVTLIRAVFLGMRTPPREADDAPQAPSARAPTDHVRVEPRVGLD
jgi:hypothetical protein